MSDTKRGDRFVAYRASRPCERLFITVTRVAKDGSWADIKIQTWAVMWSKRQKLDHRGWPPDAEPYPWSWKDLNEQEVDHMDMLRERGADRNLDEALEDLAESPVPIGGHAALHEVLEERARQDDRWGTSFPGRSHDRWLTILTEEVGEAAEAILQSDGTTDKRRQTRADVRREVVQITAVGLSWLQNGEWGEP